MPHKRTLALAAAAAMLAGCAAPAPPTPSRRPSPPPPSARLGTVTPAYPVGAELERGIEVLDRIPAEHLSTSGSAALDAADPCAGVPAAVVESAGFASPPVHDSELGCGWRGSGMGLEIGAAPPRLMAKEVEEHLADATPGSADPLAHLAWLRIDDHYAIERILKFDASSSCWLSLDLSAPAIVYVFAYPVDPATGDPAESDPDTSVRTVCPVTRQVAKNLLAHLDEQKPGWWEPWG